MTLTVVVFGGTSGYGAGIAEVLRQDGFDVVAVSRSSDPPCDARDYAQVKALADSLPDVLAVVYSAGLAIGKEPVGDGDPDAWKQVFETNTLGLMHAVKAFLPHLIRSQGHVISIGSIATGFAYAGAADYCASKAAQTRVMECLRFELLGTGIRTTSLEPGLGETDFQRRRYAGDMDKAAAHYAGVRQLQPYDLGITVSWLLDLPVHMNVDSLVVKPLDQATHGVTAKRT